MVTTTNVVDALLEDASQHIYDNYSYISIGTGTTPIADGATLLTAGVTIQSTSFNKVRETTSYINGRNMSMLFNIEPSEPQVQPINVGEVGLVSGSAKTSTLGVGAKLNVVQTKDNTVKHRWRLALSFIRTTEV